MMIYQPMDFPQAKAEAAEYARERHTETMVVILEDEQFMWVTTRHYITDDAIHPFQEAWYSACGKAENEALLATAITWMHQR